MPHIFIDDGYPEADEYASNYLWYDDDDPESFQRALNEARRFQTERKRFAASWMGRFRSPLRSRA